MATKNCDLALGGKLATFYNLSFSNQENSQQQYSNLNLNAVHQSAAAAKTDDPVQSKSISFRNDERKVDDYKNSNAKNVSNLWNKKSQQNSLNLLNGGENEVSEKQWKKKDATNDSTKNSSTLSLHIAAYENNIEPASNVAVDKEEKTPATKKKAKLASTVSSPTLTSMLSPFEIPRQQGDQTSDPEVMQFKASQRLLNSNAVGSSDQIVSENVAALSLNGVLSVNVMSGLIQGSGSVERNGYGMIAVDENNEDSFLTNAELLPEINLLVIGETGVGKSTLINALANYISHETMNDALKADKLINVIPTKFLSSERQNGQLVQRTIRVGTSDNENFTEGHSSTQHPKAYVFIHNNNIYQIIDTPGIGDSRGIEQDGKNMENIMQYIYSQFNEIHGICFLMKPNESRLTPSFEWCFKRLLQDFHESAVENILFCFPCSYGYGFQVAETLSPLSMLGEEIEKERGIEIPLTVERMYACDNMAHRYLCAAKHHNAEYPPNQQEMTKYCYKKSRDVMFEMLQFVSTRTPHNIADSLAVYCARNAIQKLYHPLTLIGNALHETREKIEEKQQLIQQYRYNEEQLKENVIVRVLVTKAREKAEDEIAELQQFVNELLAEKDVINEASARCAHFLNRSSIILNNDGEASYLKKIIEREKSLGNETKQKAYEKRLSEYHAGKKALKKHLQNALPFGNVVITTADIMETLEDLKDLEHSGRDIAAAIG